MKRNPVASLLRIAGLLSIAAAVLLALVSWDAYRFLTSPLPISQGQLVQLPKGASLRTLGERLLARGTLQNVRDILYLDSYGRVHRKARQLKAGEYQIKPGMSPVGLLNAIVQGHIYHHSLAIIDGWTFRQMMSAIESDPALRHLLQGDSKQQVMKAIGHGSVPAEGRFFPNTYYFPKGMTDVAFLKRAYNAMKKALGKQWAQRKKGLPLKNKEQALTLASIIERESANPGELGRISGVFIRRLKKGMKLETDPTVMYGLESSFDGNLTRTDLRKNTPYNTYIHYGLPPTPICLPSLAALHAAVHPKPGKALYFVAKGNGTHHFSDTFAEHKRAIRKYEFHEK